MNADFDLRTQYSQSDMRKSGDVSAADDRVLSCRRAQDKASYWAAFRLIYLAYLRRGLARPNRLGLRFLPHQLLTTSSVLLAECRELDIGTVSIIEDGEFGVPIEFLYPSDVARLRREGNSLAELTCLAASTTENQGRRSILRALLRSALQLAKIRRIDFLTLCIHPRHARFYQDRLGFARLGPPRYCPWVCGQPAIGMYLPLHDMKTAEAFLHQTDPPWFGLADLILNPPGDDIRECFQQFVKEASPFALSAHRLAAA